MCAPSQESTNFWPGSYHEEYMQEDTKQSNYKIFLKFLPQFLI